MSTSLNEYLLSKGAYGPYRPQPGGSKALHQRRRWLRTAASRTHD